MDNAKPVNTSLASHFRLSKDQAPKMEEEKELMAKILYASAIGSLMYTMGYVDVNFTGEVDHRISSIGYVFTVGTTTVSWMSRIQKIVSLSTTEVEYVAVTEARN
ncbi:hypothetical protein KIW84_012487 [Lathyrus oleraceus]|uniref:Uncharacterized protein n=1 Tax=Pisum sativum TaxID=3888 RepID=A0A9D5GWE3_PEA|nr:hypothetical protein KIW84_012487 [Pisum sativum]